MRVELVLGANAAHATQIEALLPLRVRDTSLVLLNDPAVRDVYRSKGLAARVLSEQVPIDSPDDHASYEAAHEEVRTLGRSLSDVRYRSVPVFGALEAQLVGDLVFFHRAAAALMRAQKEGVGSVVLALTHYNATYAGLLEVAAAAGHETAKPLRAMTPGLVVLSTPLVEDTLSRTLVSDEITPDAPQPRPDWLPARDVVSIFYLLTNDADLYLRPVYPVIDEFRAARTPFLVLTEDSRVVENLASRDVEVIDVRRVRRLMATLDVGRRRRRQAAISTLLARVEREADASHSHALRALLRSQRNDAVVRQADEWMANVDVVDAALAWARPRSVFLMPDAMQSSVMVSSLGSAHRIPTVTTVAASVAGTARALGTYRADFVACYGHECVEAFRDIGWHPSRIVLTGAPGLDAARRVPREKDREELARRGSLDLERPIVVVATSRPSETEDRWILRLLGEGAVRGWQIVVRPHPLHGARAYAGLLRNGAGSALRLMEGIDLRVLLHAADVVVTDYSHAGREALAAERPLVTVNISGVPYPNNRYDEEGVALPAQTEDEVVHAVDRALTDEAAREAMASARRTLVDRFNWRNDGRSARRLYELLVAPPDRAGRTDA